MTIDGIHSVQGRIAEIQQSINRLAGVGATRADFAGALRQAMGAAGLEAGTGVGDLAVGGVEGFDNGRIPESLLRPIAPGQRLSPPTAAAFGDMAAAARAAGITLRVTDSYRSYDEQVHVAAHKGLYSEGGLAATPGTSNHGRGLSVDLDTDPSALTWLRANAGRFGFVEDVPREPWHWTFRSPATRPSRPPFDPDRLRLPAS